MNNFVSLQDLHKERIHAEACEVCTVAKNVFVNCILKSSVEFSTHLLLLQKCRNVQSHTSLVGRTAADLPPGCTPQNCDVPGAVPIIDELLQSKKYIVFKFVRTHEDLTLL